ncbi:hypothetical protein P3S68_012026 [Capsicum galapagoense]
MLFSIYVSLLSLLCYDSGLFDAVYLMNKAVKPIHLITTGFAFSTSEEEQLHVVFILSLLLQ